MKPRGLADVSVREVGLRDGLQSLQQVLSTEAKIAWLKAAHAAGLREIEVSSFVSPKLVPQLADAADVLQAAQALPGLTASVLVPNLRGAELALERGAAKLVFVVSASEAHNRANVRQSAAESLSDFARIGKLAAGEAALTGGISTAFGCTLQGAVDQARVVNMAVQMAELGASEIALADTVGYANPTAVRDLFGAVRSAMPGMPLAAHFHDTRGLGLANVVAALDTGVCAFDASLGGFGGCPYAPGATGNIATEDLVFLLESMGHTTGIDLDRLLAVRRRLTEWLPGVPLQGAVAQAGLPKGSWSAASLRS